MNTLAPWEAGQKIITSLSLRLIVWAFITVACIYLFYYIGIRKRRDKSETWQTVLWELLSILGWIFFYYIEMHSRIVSEAATKTPLFLMGIVVLPITPATISLLRRTELWHRIISGVMVGIVGFGMLAAFGSDNEPYGYAILMGSLLGLLVGLAYYSIRVILNPDYRISNNSEEDNITEQEVSSKLQKYARRPTGF